MKSWGEYADAIELFSEGLVQDWLLNMITFTMYMLLYLIFKDKYVKIFKDILFRIGIYRQTFLLTIDI